MLTPQEVLLQEVFHKVPKIYSNNFILQCLPCFLPLPSAFSTFLVEILLTQSPWRRSSWKSSRIFPGLNPWMMPVQVPTLKINKVPTLYQGSYTRQEPSFGFWSFKLELHLNLEQGWVFSFLYRQWSFGKTIKCEDYKLDQWTNSRESFSVFSGILYGEPRSQQSLHQISLKIFRLMSSEGLLGVLTALFQWKLGAPS